MMAGKRLLDPYRVGLVLGVGAPDQRPCVDLVSEDEVDAVLGPEISCGAGDALVVEGAGDVQHPRTGLGHVEDALHDAGRIGVGFQGGPLLRPVLHHDPVVAVGRPAADPEAARGGLPHPPRDLLGQDIGYPINTKRSDTHGRLGLIRVRYLQDEEVDDLNLGVTSTCAEGIARRGDPIPASLVTRL